MWEVTQGGYQQSSLSHATKSPTLWSQKRCLVSPPLLMLSKITPKPPNRPQTYLLQYAKLRLSNMMPSRSCASFRKPVELPVSQASFPPPASGDASEITEAAAMAIASNSSGCRGAWVMMLSVAAFPARLRNEDGGGSVART